MQAADIGFRMTNDFKSHQELGHLNPSFPPELKIFQDSLQEQRQKLTYSNQFSVKRKYASTYLRYASVFALLDYFKYQPKKHIFELQSKPDGTEN